MVLSNKKLKQKLRTQLAESLSKSESLLNQLNLNDSQTHQSFKSILNSITQKPNLSKREIRRIKTPSLEKSSELENGGLKENKKRKREKDGGDEGKDVNEVKDLSEKKSSKKKNKKKKNKKKKVVKKEEEGVQKENDGNEEQVVFKKVVKKEEEGVQKENDGNEEQVVFKKVVKKEEEGVQKENDGNEEQVVFKKVVKKEEEGVQKENDGNEEQVVVEPIQTHITQISKEDESISTKVYVGGIPYYSTLDDIRSFFEGCGSITEIDCLKFPETGKFNGIAMISFRTEAAAKRALGLDGSDMGGLLLKVQPYKAHREKKVSDFAPAMLDGYNRIYVGNLSWDMTEDELKNFFSDCSISSVRLGKDKETGEFKGFAHVDFSDSLSLTMALKLDQKPLFGRPVRVRCAVPPKSANPGSNSDPAVCKKEDNVKFVSVVASGDAVVNDDMARKAKRQTCYECGEKGHLSLSYRNKITADLAYTSNKNNNVAYTSYETDDVAFDNDKGEVDNIGDGKLKRRTCYECGEKGHLSSSCPNKKAADVAYTGNKTDDVAFDKYREEVDDIGDGKLERRTYYECGEKGHLSSLCPKKQAADMGNSGRGTFASVVVADNEGVDYNMVNSVSDGKLRRRTCYECGERGHLSSACPKKQAADVANDMEVKKAKEIKTFAAVDNVASSVTEGKLRRRTCYECGERGHLSSLCPKKQTADVAISRKEADYMEVEKFEEVKTTPNVSDGKLRRRNCYECGLKGHLSSLCPNKKETGLPA